MRILALMLLILPLAASANGPASPVGHWEYYKKIYQGKDMPMPPDATLRLHYEYRADGTSRLFWWNEGENNRCSREGKYTLEEGVIVEEATTVDPGNHPTCSSDPDMHEGKVSRTPYTFVNGDLHLTLPLGDEVLIYVWKLVTP